jgi:hypothetical protein
MPDSATESERLSARASLTIATFAGLGGGATSVFLATRNTGYGDFLAWWFGSRVMFAGGNPYATPPDVAPYFIAEQLFYPATALVASGPFAALPYLIALGTFFGAGSALLAWGIATKAPHQLAIFCSFPYIMAAHLGHWSPWMTAALLVPALGFLVAVKPNLGLAAAVTRPSRSMFIGAALLIIVSLLIAPSWPLWWRNAMAEVPTHVVPFATWYGAPLLLAALRWRTHQGRLLLAMSLMPQTATFADQLLVMLVARTRFEAVLLAAMSAIGGVAWLARLRWGGHPAMVGGPYVVLSIYLPALLIVLRHKNTGAIPQGLERRIARVPIWLRGESQALTK